MMRTLPRLSGSLIFLRDAALDDLLDPAALEQLRSQVRRHLRDGEELLAAGALPVSGDGRRRADHLCPQRRAQPLERSEQCGDLLRAKISEVILMTDADVDSSIYWMGASLWVEPPSPLQRHRRGTRTRNGEATAL